MSNHKFNLEAFLGAYMVAALFTCTGANDESSDASFLDLNYHVTDIDQDSVTVMRKECEAFYAANTALLDEACDRTGYGAESAGHDFWLTRNGHGVGFWDRIELAHDGLGDKLTEACKTCPEVSLYMGDNGKIYYSAA